MSTKQVRWAILGTSPISETIANAIRESKTSELVAVHSRSIEKAKSFANKFSIPKYYDNADAFLADPEIDAIYIGLPNHLHKEWIIRCAQARKHIICEKPFVTNLQDAQEALAAVNKANVFCMEALMYRCHPVIQKLSALMKKKVIGEVRFFNAMYTANIQALANPEEGGSILNLGCYPVSLVRLLAGCAHGKHTAEPSNVVSIGELDDKEKNDTRATVLLQFPKNMLATISTADDIEMYSQFDVYGTDGCLKMLTNPWKPEKESKILIQRNHQSEPEIITVEAEQSLYSYQFDVANEHIQAGNNFVEVGATSWLDTLGNIVVLEAWRKQVMKITG